MCRWGRRSKDKAQEVVDAIYSKCIHEGEDGSWWMDNLTAVAIVRKALKDAGRLREEGAREEGR